MDADAVRSAAAALFVDCFPLVLTDVVRAHHPVGGQQFRLLTNEAGALAPGLEAEDELTVLTSAWVDLGDGPVVVRLPATGGRFFDLTLIDSAGDPFASLGTRTGEEAGLALALVGPRWEGQIPDGLKPKRATSALVWIVTRIRAHSALDLPQTLSLAKRQSLVALRSDRRTLEPAVTTSEPPSPPCLRHVLGMSPEIFFHRLEAILERAPPPRQRVLRPRVRALLAELSGPPPRPEWTADYAAAVAGGFADAVEAIRAAAAPGSSHGWRELGGGAAREDADALARAAHACAHLGAPLREDLLSLVCARDDAGLPLSGDQSYTLHFSRDGLPPANASWRLSAVPPARNDRRHGIGDRNDPAPNDDGSLDLLLQRAAPGPSMLANWLALPEGRLSLVVRLYAPGPAALSGAWRMPTPQRATGPAAGRRPRLSSPPMPPKPDLGALSAAGQPGG
jgi:hypothetical protein